MSGCKSIYAVAFVIGAPACFEQGECMVGHVQTLDPSHALVVALRAAVMVTTRAVGFLPLFVCHFLLREKERMSVCAHRILNCARVHTHRRVCAHSLALRSNSLAQQNVGA